MKRETNTGVKGISRMSKDRPSPFQAYFRFGNKTQYIGAFASIEEARKARNKFINSLK